MKTTATPQTTPAKTPVVTVVGEFNNEIIVRSLLKHAMSIPDEEVTGQHEENGFRRDDDQNKTASNSAAAEAIGQSRNRKAGRSPKPKAK